jgi:hypothetical protein
MGPSKLLPQTPNPIPPKQANAKTQIPTSELARIAGEACEAGYTAEVPLTKYLNLPSCSSRVTSTHLSIQVGNLKQTSRRVLHLPGLLAYRSDLHTHPSLQAAGSGSNLAFPPSKRNANMQGDNDAYLSCSVQL